MRRGFFLVFLALSTLVSGKTYYVAPSGGKDSNPGTISQPWATWQKAFDSAQAGDTVYFRGGVWYPSNYVQHNPLEGHGYNGTYDSPICFFNYPGEDPILDAINFTSTIDEAALAIVNSTYVKFRGLTIRNKKEKVADHFISAVQIFQYNPNVGNYVIYLDRITSHDNGGHGFRFYSYDTLYVTNCDSYNNADIMSDEPGNRADGFTFGAGEPYSDTTKVIYINGCRSWHNSDDGFDIGSTRQYQINNNWSFINGYLPFGAGVGFKTTNSTVRMPSKRRIYNNLSAFNHYDGFSAQNLVDNILGPVNEIYNNTSYRDMEAFSADQGEYNCTSGYMNVIYKNNLAYKSHYSSNEYYKIYITTCGALPSHPVQEYNSWIWMSESPYWEDNPAISVTDEDFLFAGYSVSDSTAAIMQLTAPRKADGSLPDITFLKLKEGSDLIDAGVDVGLPFNGDAPDIGYSEYFGGAVTPTAPQFVSAVVENASPNRLDITYSLTLANIVPATSAFTVTVNSLARSVSSVAISGFKVLLTLVSPVYHGDVVTVAYTKPSTNSLQTNSGGQAVSFAAKNVTNNVAASIPSYVGSVIENDTPSKVEITYNLTLANIIPPASAFTVIVNSLARSVNSVAISGSRVILTLVNPVSQGDLVTVAYTKPSTNSLQTNSGGQAVSFTAKNVTNNVTASIPAYIGSVIENDTPSRVDITYNLILANIIPANSAFTVTVNSLPRSVNSVTISGSRVLLTLVSPASHGDLVTVAYTKPSSNPLQTSAGGQVTSMTAQPVSNQMNAPPIISITSPTKSITFVAPATIIIEVTAYDLDGSISRVEFFNGNSKIGEVSSGSFNFTWKDVPEGTYSLTAVASDNLNAKTVSGAVEVVVEKSTNAVNQLPVVNITSPNKSKKYRKHDKIVIIADAFDPDGTISKVQLKNGSVTISEISVAPYSFTLENIDTGKYVITAVAIDNLGASSSSSDLELTVVPYDYNPDLINLYPNPNNGHFIIDLSPDLNLSRKITIVDLSGKPIFKDILNDQENTMEFNLSGTSPGTYILMVTNDDAIVTTKKFILK